jgi:iron complex transport system substrate-binding protein
LLVSFITGCRSSLPVQPAAQREFTDGLNRKLTLADTPQRIISLAPNITEILFALGLSARVVGVTTYCDFPAEAKTKEQVGDTIQPNLERIIALKPDLVIITTSSQLEKITQQLDELKIPVYVSNPRTVAEVSRSILSIGELTGATERARAIATEIEQRIGAVRERVKDLPRPRVFYVLQNAPLITAGHNTFINDLITLAGGESISGAERADYPQFSRETVIARAPEIIIVPESHGTELVSVAEVRRDFTETPAVRAGRIVSINPDLTDRPGPRIVAGLEQLASAIHGQKNSAAK